MVPVIAPSTSVTFTSTPTVPPSATIPVTAMLPVASSSTGFTVSTNVSEAFSPLGSDAVTVRLMLPLKFNGGVPEKVCVAALNFSQVGSGEPLPEVAV